MSDRLSGPDRHKVYLGRLFHLLSNPHDSLDDPSPAWRYFETGALVVDPAGIVAWLGDKADLPQRFRDDAEHVSYEHERYLITPGLIDAHVHSTQIDAIAFGGLQLLPWLQRSVFPAEDRFSDPAHARRYGTFFLKTLLMHGTTTASVHTASHPQAAMALHELAHRCNMRMNIGIVLMDSGFNDIGSAHLNYPIDQIKPHLLEQFETWHGTGRQTAVITPRFALSCTPEMLTIAGEFYNGGHAPGWLTTAGERRMFLQTHFAENRKEIADTESSDGYGHGRRYLEVYREHGLVGPRTNLHHAIHLRPSDRELLKRHDCGLSHCPDSNGHLGSGWFDLHTNGKDHGLKIGLGTDCGAGTNYSLLQTMHDGYKTCILRENSWDWATLRDPDGNPQPERPPDDRMDFTAFQAFWLATMGGAEVLGHDGVIGNLLPGKEADFVVWDMWATPVLKQRVTLDDPELTFHDQLFGFMMLGGSGLPVQATYVMGRKLYDRDRHGPSGTDPWGMDPGGLPAQAS